MCMLIPADSHSQRKSIRRAFSLKNRVSGINLFDKDKDKGKEGIIIILWRWSYLVYYYFYFKGTDLLWATHVPPNYCAGGKFTVSFKPIY